MEAFNLCQDLGGHLAELTTQGQMDALAEVPSFTESLMRISHWWIGLSDLGLEGEFRWQGTGLSMGESSRAPQRPNMDPFNRNYCVSLSKQFGKISTFLWVVSSCEELKAPLCQAPELTTSTTSSTLTTVTTETVITTKTTTTTETITTVLTARMNGCSSTTIAIRF